MAGPDAVHRAIVVVDIAESTHPVRTNHDRLVIRAAMYDALEQAFGEQDWPQCRRYDRGDGVLILVPPDVPKARLVTGLPARLETVLACHNAAMEERGGERAVATQIQLRVAVHAGEVTFDRHGVVGAAIDHTFRLVDAEPTEDSPGWLDGRLCAHRLGLVLPRRRVPPSGRPAGQLPARRLQGEGHRTLSLAAGSRVEACLGRTALAATGGWP